VNSVFDLTGQQALVTGANTGLGQGMAVALAEAGANIVAVGRSPADETKNAVEATGRRFTDIRADLLDRATVRTVVSHAEDRAGPSNILVNNAGIIRRSDALEFSENDWDDVMDVNIRTLFFLSQDFAASVVRRKQPGKVINVASMLSYQGGIRVASYTASKSGVMGLTRLLANEWAGQQINVNAIAPGYFATNNTAALQADESRNKQILERIPAGRWGAPADLAGGVVFLASAASNYVHGITLPIDGGWLAR